MGGGDGIGKCEIFWVSRAREGKSKVKGGSNLAFWIQKGKIWSKNDLSQGMVYLGLLNWDNIEKLDLETERTIGHGNKNWTLLALVLIG